MTEAISAITSKENLPTCALCKSPMAIREGRDGQEFWGCSTYPFTKCKGKPVQAHAKHDDVPPWELDDMEENS
jgi:ssDNA-binding Zn-finger/Zn-ribbon topoisomerase 1